MKNTMLWLAFVPFAIACGGSNEPADGPAERAGEKMDNAGDKVEQKADEAGEKVEEAGDKVEQKVDEEKKD